MIVWSCEGGERDLLLYQQERVSEIFSMGWREGNAGREKGGTYQCINGDICLNFSPCGWKQRGGRS